MTRKDKGPIYCVYVILDLRFPGLFQYRQSQLFHYKPIYIGMGRPNRYLEHLNECKLSDNKLINPYKTRIIRKNLKNFSYDQMILFMYENLFVEQALETEIFLIKQIGRKDQHKGPLCNLTDGGDGVIGYVFTKEEKEKMRQTQKIVQNLPEIKDKIKKARSTIEWKENASKIQKEIHSRKEVIEKTKKTCSNSEWKKNYKKLMKEAFNKPENKIKREQHLKDPEWIKKFSLIQKQTNSRPEKLKKFAKTNSNPEVKEKRRKSAILQSLKPEVKLNKSFHSTNLNRKKRNEQVFLNIREYLNSLTEKELENLKKRFNIKNLEETVKYIERNYEKKSI